VPRLARLLIHPVVAELALCARRAVGRNLGWVVVGDVRLPAGRMLELKDAAFLAKEPDRLEALLYRHATFELRTRRPQIALAFAYIGHGPLTSRACAVSVDRVDEHVGDKLRGELLASSDTDLIDAVLGLQDAIDQDADADAELHYLQRVALVTAFSRLAPGPLREAVERRDREARPQLTLVGG
jgi:hypothetical protein